MQTIRAIARSLKVLLRSWSHVDRIRISPMEGRLLSLQPGQRILLRERIYVVFSPAVGNPANMREIAIRLESDEGPAYLTMQRTADGNTCSAQLLNHPGQQEDIFDDDVNLLPPGDSHFLIGPGTKH